MNVHSEGEVSGFLCTSTRCLPDIMKSGRLMLVADALINLERVAGICLLFQQMAFSFFLSEAVSIHYNH